MTEPPPDVAAPEHRWIWYEACRLLEENAGFTSLSKYAEIGEDKCNNSLMEQEHGNRKDRGALA